MSDDKTRMGEAGRDRVSEDQDHEIRILARKYGRSPEVVRTVVRGVGPMRSDIEAELSKGAARGVFDRMPA